MKHVWLWTLQRVAAAGSWQTVLPAGVSSRAPYMPMHDKGTLQIDDQEREGTLTWSCS